MDSIFERIGKIVGEIVDNLMFIALLGMVILVTANVFMRYVLNTGIPQSEELARYLFVWVVFMGAITAFKEKKHVGVDILVSRLKGIPRRIINTISYIFVVIACAIMLKGGIAFTKLSMSSLGPATKIPFSYVSISYVIAALVMGVMAVIGLVKIVTKGEEL